MKYLKLYENYNKKIGDTHKKDGWDDYGIEQKRIYYDS